MQSCSFEEMNHNKNLTLYREKNSSRYLQICVLWSECFRNIYFLIIIEHIYSIMHKDICIFNQVVVA